MCSSRSYSRCRSHSSVQQLRLLLGTSCSWGKLHTLWAPLVARSSQVSKLHGQCNSRRHLLNSHHIPSACMIMM